MYCPYCFSRMNQRTLVCKNAQCAMFDQSMPEKSCRLLSRLPAQLRVRFGPWMADRETRCDACGLPCAAVCESCGRQIPSVWMRYPSRNVLFLGVNGVGKSTLLATSKLMLSQRPGLTLTPLEAEETAERFYDHYAKALSERNESVAHTANEMPRPFLWGVASSNSVGPSSAMALAIYDVPGEMLRRHADAAPIETLLSCADSAVLVINPASLPAVKEACGEAAKEILPAPDCWERAERILDELLRSNGIGRKSPLKIAVVLTHLDVWFSALPECDSTRALTEPYLRMLIERWHGGAFLTRLNEFQNHRLFASGLYREKECRPLDGAEAPLQYLLHCMGMRF